MSADRMRVILISAEDEIRTEIFNLTSSDCMAAAKALWALETSRESDSFELVSYGQTFPDDAPLSSVPVLRPGIVVLAVEPKVHVTVRLSGGQRHAEVIYTALSTRAAQLYEQARVLFDLPEGRAVRFRAGPVVLSDESPLQAVGACELDLEPGWRLPEQRTDGSCCELLVFWSELLQRIASREVRIRCGAAIITETAAAEAVLLADLRGSAPHPLLLEAAGDVTVLEEGSVRSQAVWPSGKLTAEHEMMLHGDLVPCTRLPALPYSCLLYQSLRLVLVWPDKRRTVLRLPRDGCVLDLLSAIPSSERFEAVLESHRLPEHAPLWNLQDREVKLRRLQVEIRVCFGEKELPWALPEDREEVTFGEIVAGVSAGQRDQRKVLLSGILACQGCGRRLSRERQEVQYVPADCCEQRSMRLHYAAKTKPRDVSAQTRIETRDVIIQANVQEICSATQTKIHMTHAAKKKRRLTAAEGDLKTKGDCDCLEGAPKSQEIGVSIRFPDHHVVRYNFGSDYTLEALIEALRASGQLLRADDVSLRGRSLLTGPDSRLRSLKTCDIRDGDELLVTARLPQEVHVWNLSTNELSLVTVGRGENCWRSISAKLASAPSSCVLYQEKLLYLHKSEWRSAVDSGVQETSEGPYTYTYFDEEDGRTADEGEQWHFVTEFLTPDEGIRAATRGTPQLRLLNEVCGLEDGAICGLEASALFDPQFIACIESIRCLPSQRGTKKVFLSLTDCCYFEISSGRIIGSFRDVHNFARDLKMSVSVFVLLLREGDVIPHFTSAGPHHLCQPTRWGGVENRRPLLDARDAGSVPTEHEPVVESGKGGRFR